MCWLRLTLIWEPVVVSSVWISSSTLSQPGGMGSTWPSVASIPMLSPGLPDCCERRGNLQTWLSTYNEQWKSMRGKWSSFASLIFASQWVLFILYAPSSIFSPCWAHLNVTILHQALKWECQFLWSQEVAHECNVLALERSTVRWNWSQGERMLAPDIETVSDAKDRG